MRILVGKGSGESFMFPSWTRCQGTAKESLQREVQIEPRAAARQADQWTEMQLADPKMLVMSIWFQVKKLERERCLHLSIFMSWLRRRAAPEVLERGLCHGGPQMRLPIALSPSFTQLICSAVTQLLFWSRLWAVELMGPGQMRMQRLTQKGGYRFCRVVSLLVNSWHEKCVSHPCLTGCSSISEN